MHVDNLIPSPDRRRPRDVHGSMNDMGRAVPDELDRELPGTAHRGLQGRTVVIIEAQASDYSVE
ncbi:hypothetical protein BO83DRAFT_374674 [Aspergillus eucalypticola CBS 122712]|uniref:Uncharacterized protein n=1 Tax=Aspergillus eucalypticola (strain CBS 122712 / IBT 29274) TaxID=1448314 RepID=A0A317WDF2_ASPEC|nr:uncharacterized protein BO83DRAFT_374674 [Aspergillus eucalypticola CBS 122712]PWY84289.1 hypothetical protein BO83DRAFT_374674 [Aspergillus eucalypticola CBS 122712]